MYICVYIYRDISLIISLRLRFESLKQLRCLFASHGHFPLQRGALAASNGFLWASGVCLWLYPECISKKGHVKEHAQAAELQKYQLAQAKMHKQQCII